MTFQQLLSRLDTLLQQHRPEYYATLAPPATATELDALEAAFQLKLPTELRQWYGWHNGHLESKSIFQNHEFIQGNSLAPLSSVAESMRVNCELLAAGEYFMPNWWQTNWVPFLENGGGDHICLDLEGTFTGQPGQVLEQWHDMEQRTVLFPDLTAWLRAVVQAYEQAGAQGQLTDEQTEDLELEYPSGFPLAFEAG
ncbi:SMI1/KNR4 family protein [Hymenobacter sp. J193]|uniref:SMI1/KNR4 family protein n=1 Tax=Hymenobacter sp. J193 TaxID=2898429 RepID=UPI002150E09A|nr:SMI1/KNR4 family protein [Hymenobacter sp. J193]MCR5890039.1 SMI1/KNR4 family protein [Hymenobacter sp. J193]